MEVRRVARGLWTWTAPHPSWNGADDWPEAVGCVYYEAPDAVVLIDPQGIGLVVPEGADDGQVAFFIRSHRALVVAEIFAGERGGLRVCPSPALRNRAAFEASLRRLLELPIEHVLVAHGEPVLGGGRAAVARALASASG